MSDVPEQCYRQKLNDSMSSSDSRREDDDTPDDIFDLCTVNRVDYLDANISKDDSRSDMEKSPEPERLQVIAVQRNNVIKFMKPIESINLSALSSAFKTLNMDKSRNDESFASCHSHSFEQVFIPEAPTDITILDDETEYKLKNEKDILGPDYELVPCSSLIKSEETYAKELVESEDQKKDFPYSFVEEEKDGEIVLVEIEDKNDVICVTPEKTEKTCAIKNEIACLSPQNTEETLAIKNEGIRLSPEKTEEACGIKNIIHPSPKKTENPHAVMKIKVQADVFKTPDKPAPHGVKRRSSGSKGRKSSGVTISPLKFESPDDPKAERWQTEYNAILKSKSPLNDRYARYEEYSKLKLEINQIQQKIAQLTIDRKVKERELIKLDPGKVRFVPKKLKESAKEIRTQKEILKIQVDELQESVKAFESVLQILKTENHELEVSVDKLEGNIDEDLKKRAKKLVSILKLSNLPDTELETSQDDNKRLKAALAKQEEVVMSLQAQLAAAKKKSVANEKMLENLRTTLGFNLGKTSSEDKENIVQN